MKKIYKQIYKEIKKYNNIFIARHIGPDPDALGSQLALKEIIRNMFPKKNVYAIGSPASKFKFIGVLDKVESIPDNSLLIVLDTPDIKRIDGVDISKFNTIVKIDHHPKVDNYAKIECIDEDASSTSQMILEMIFSLNLYIDKNIGEKLYIGIVSDTDRFLHDYTSVRTFDLVTKLIKRTNIDFTKVYEPLYLRPLVEIKFQGYIYQNLEITNNGVAYIKITDDMMKEYKVDSASAGNMINNLKYVEEILIWVFFSEDKKSNLIRANIRSRGPYINELASRFGGGGHKYASGARLTSWKQVDSLIEELDKLLEEYKKEEVS